MPQETNLNVSPYFDDFDEDKGYHKVLFKPGFPIQARELTTLQSILQNQIEQHGKNIFKEGSVVIPGQIRYESPYYAVEIDPTYNGIDVSAYFSELVGKRIQGASSGVTAEIVNLLSNTESERGNYTLYVRYISNGGVDFTNRRFQDSETILLLTPFSINNLVFQLGQGICNTRISNAISDGSAASVAEGVYFVRGYFVKVNPQTIILDQYNNNPSYRVGFNVIESVITSDDDESLFDNANSFSNFSAPGADRFKIELELTKKDIADIDTENFVEIFRVENGTPEFYNKNVQYNLIRDELSRRTSDISGDFIVRPFTLNVRDSLNDGLLNRGLFNSDQLTANGNVPSDDLMIYQIGPGKAYVNGYDVETSLSKFIDVPKPRTTNTVNNNLINFNAGVLCIVNNSYGTPNIGIATTSTVKLMDSRIGELAYQKTGNEIGEARVYDFVPESDYVNDTSRLQLRLFDIETYTSINLTAEITLATPAIIKGKRSKASGYLRESVSNSKTLKLYGVSGNFSENEPISINEIDNTRLITSVTDYSLSDVKSLYSEVGISTFNSDVVLTEKTFIEASGTLFNINNGVVSAGLDKNFIGKVKVGDIISYTSSTYTGDPIYNKVSQLGVGGTTFTLTGITTVSGVCDGKLEVSSFNVTNIFKLNNNFSSQDSSLFTILNKKNVNSVGILETEIVQRRLFNSQTVNSNKTIVIDIDPLDVDIFFESFDEDRYVITYPDGSIEPMRLDKFAISNTGKRVTFRDLAKSSGTANVITTVVNKSPSSKNKKFNKVSSIIVSKSKFNSSGIGTTTLNDGLSYSEIYGTRVQDEEISLNLPDVVRVLAVYESSGAADPILPILQLTSFSGPSNSNIDYIVGEKIKGQTSGAYGIIVSRQNSDKIEYVNLNSFSFELNEIIEGEESKVTSIISSRNIEDKNITQNYLFDNGQRDHFYDYSRIIRKSDISEPSKKLKIVFQNYTIDSNDTGEFITVNSYSTSSYKHDIPYYENNRLSDVIDIRPRVSPYISGSKSPFEFDSRNFALDGQYSKYILAPGESINVNYSYYQGRIDLINLNSDGTFEVIQGIPSDDPTPPAKKLNSLDLAYVYIQPYVFDIKNINFDYFQHRRYTMSDISLLEDRIERVEKFTTLSMLESKTENLLIKDAETGLDRFKSGFFVDDFSNHDFHDIENPYFNAAIDDNTKTLRPRHYTTFLDLQLESIPAYGIRKTGDLVTLNYSEVLYFEQPYATKTESVTPFLTKFWIGSVTLSPPKENWIEEKKTLIKTINRNLSITTLNNGNVVSTANRPGNVTQTINGVLQSNPQTGIIADSFDWITNASNWVSRNQINRTNPLSVTVNNNVIQVNAFRDRINSNNRNEVFDAIRSLLPTDVATQFISQVSNASNNNGNRIFVNFTSPSTRAVNSAPTTTNIQNGNISSITRTITSITSQRSAVVDTEKIRYLRSRNIEFDAKKLKPLTRFYSFFGGINVDAYITPKLVEITMISGSFEVGEVVKSTGSSNSYIQFKLCRPDHQSGPISSPTTSYRLIPYNQQPPSITYSSSSNYLNIDTNSLQLPSDSSSYGKVAVGMILEGSTSKARARITNVRLISDNYGNLIGSLFIPDPSVEENPKWLNGENTFTLVDVPVLDSNSESPNLESRADFDFVSSGILRQRTINITTTRNIQVVRNIRTQNQQTTVGNERRDPLAQSFYVLQNSGVFLSSVEVYFETKDESDPVTLQIRPMISGIPGNTIVPFSEVHLMPDEVNVSTDGSVSTKFAFPSLVYLNGPQEQNEERLSASSQQTSEYAIVLLSDSSNYRVFIAETGKVDVSSGVRISRQPTLGSLFKSQNGTVWTPSQLEDLKYKLNRADFVTEGLVRFYNPELSIKNGKVTVTGDNQFVALGKRTIVGLGSTGYNASQIVPGVTIIQGNASGTLSGIAGSIKTGVGVTIVNTGSGYTGAGTTFTNVNLITETGNGSGAIVDIDISAVTSGISTVTVVNGGSGYQVGDSLIIPEIGSGVGFGGKVSVISLGSSNSFVIDNVQGTFVTGITTLRYINSSGTSTVLGAGVTISSVTQDQYYTGQHMKVYHLNHGMHSYENYLKISNFSPDNTNVSEITTDISTDTISIPITTGTGIGFTVFEGKPVSSINVGYVLIDGEIIGYTSVTNDTLTSALNLRGIDSSEIKFHTTGTRIYKYELEGVSLRRINKTHNLSLINQNTHPTELNSYHIKIEMSDTDYEGVGIGSNRSNDLYFNRTTQTGNTGTQITNNIQFETLIPSVEALIFPETNVTSKVRTTTGTSIGGNEESFESAGYEDITLNSIHSFDSPRIVCSSVNEERYTNEFPEGKSLAFDFLLTSANSFISPAIDQTQTSVILTSNLINNPIGIDNDEGYADDNFVRSLESDKHSVIYLSKPVKLKIPANSIKVLFSASVTENSDIRVLYQTYRSDSPNKGSSFDLFPGNSNYKIDSNGIKKVIDYSKNNGSSDSKLMKSADESFKDYEYSIDDLADFDSFVIKIVMASNNQAKPPLIRELRAIATVKPRIK